MLSSISFNLPLSHKNDRQAQAQFDRDAQFLHRVMEPVVTDDRQRRFAAPCATAPPIAAGVA